jgi:hypothetical protein
MGRNNSIEFSARNSTVGITPERYDQRPKGSTTTPLTTPCRRKSLNPYLRSARVLKGKSEASG